MSLESNIQKGFKSHSMYFNKLSSLPMFESGSVMNKSFYNTTYRDEYVKKNKQLREISNSNNVFNYNNDSKLVQSLNNYGSYDYKELSQKLDEKNKNSENYFIRQNMNPLTRKNSITETKYSYSDFQNDGFNNAYKRPSVPSYIKRDNTYHTNAEKNITYIKAHNGNLVPSVEQKTYRRRLYRQNAINNDEDSRDRLNLVEKVDNSDLETFFSERFTKDIQPKKNQRVNELIKSQDNIFNTTFNSNPTEMDSNMNSPREKIISFIKTSNGGLISHVPTYKFEINDNQNAEFGYRENWPYNNHLKIKLHNPLNQLRRNASSLSNSFS